MDGKETPGIARPTADSVRTRLAEAGLDIPEECIAGMVSNLIVLQDHARTLRGFSPDEQRWPFIGVGA
jgi:hypothetical protein